MMTPQQAVDAYYLEVRCKLLEIAAIYDRYDRSAQAHPEAPSMGDDPRLAKCAQALSLLASSSATPDRAEQIALMFSEPIDG